MKKTLKDYEYIVGVDLGSQSTSLGYLNQSNMEPVVLDTSGGYKEGAIPTVMQYIPDEDNWLIGYSAKENLDMEEAVYLDHLLTYVEKDQNAFVAGKSYKPSELLGIYLKSLLSNFKHINPNARIICLVISVNESAYKQLKAAMEDIKTYTGIRNLSVITDQQAIGRYLHRYDLLETSVLHILDYGYRAMKHYEISCGESNDVVQLVMKEVGYHENIGCLKIEQMIRGLLIDRYKDFKQLEVVEPAVLMQIDAMLFQYYIWFFQKLREKKPLNVFYNFVYPPFKVKISADEMEKAMAMMMDAFQEIVEPIIASERFFLMGNGFRMPWTKTGIDGHENHDVILKGAVFEGCKSYMDLAEISISKVLRSKYTYTIKLGKEVITLIDKGSAFDMMYPPVAITITDMEGQVVEVPVYKVCGDMEEVAQTIRFSTDLNEMGIIRASIQLGLDIHGSLQVKHAILPL